MEKGVALAFEADFSVHRRGKIADLHVHADGAQFRLDHLLDLFLRRVPDPQAVIEGERFAVLL